MYYHDPPSPAYGCEANLECRRSSTCAYRTRSRTRSPRIREICPVVVGAGEATGQIEAGAVEGAEVVDEVGIVEDEVEHL